MLRLQQWNGNTFAAGDIWLHHAIDGAFLPALQSCSVLRGPTLLPSAALVFRSYMLDMRRLPRSCGVPTSFHNRVLTQIGICDLFCRPNRGQPCSLHVAFPADVLTDVPAAIGSTRQQQQQQQHHHHHQQQQQPQQQQQQEEKGGRKPAPSPQTSSYNPIWTRLEAQTICSTFGRFSTCFATLRPPFLSITSHPLAKLSCSEPQRMLLPVELRSFFQFFSTFFLPFLHFPPFSSSVTSRNLP